MVFPNFFNLSLNLAIRSSWSEPQSALSLFCWLYRVSPSLAAKNIINLILVLTIWWCPCVVFSFVVGRGCLLWPVHSLGKTLLAFAQLCAHQDPGEMSSDPTGDWPRLARECPGVSGRGVCPQWDPAGSGALSAAVRAGDLLKEVTIIFITATIVWPQVKKQGGTKPHPSTENWINNLLSMAPPMRTRPSFTLSQSFPSGSFHKPLILLHRRADRMKITITEN